MAGRLVVVLCAMGADIHGWVEIREAGSEWWHSVIQIDYLVYRQYGMFASLFGVRNGDLGTPAAVGHFRAIAYGRGAPPGASPHYATESEGVGETWALWSELAAIDWEEEGLPWVDDGPPHHVQGEPTTGRHRERRGDYFNGGWVTLFRLMEVLAEQFGADNVRLSVWFDQL
jgi:hypothetical protein